MIRPATRPFLALVGVSLLGLFAAVSYRSAVVEARADEARQAAPQAAPAAKDEQKKALSRFMREKLEASSQVLEGLAVEDFGLIEQGAMRMHKLGMAEEWRVSNDVLYKQHSNEFRRLMEKLQKQAKEKNLDAAALTWIEGTLNCLECHQWVRNTLIAE